jgi:hypothetical protein
MNKCVKCDSTSVILDDKVWVCSNHIEPCQCERNHESHLSWDYRGVTIESMEYEMPEMNVPDGRGGNLNYVTAPKFKDIDRKNEEVIKEWVDRSSKIS